MHLEHSFSVAAGVEQTWQALLDPHRIAGCIPGAALDSVRNGVAHGAIRVRLGALGPTYRGTASVVDKDDDGHRAVVEAAGDTRSFGEATVRLVVTLSAFGPTTNVMLQSDVALTGRAAELDEQVISDSGDRLCKQLAARLNDLLSTTTHAASPPQPPVDEPPAPPADDAPVSPPPAPPADEPPLVPPPAAEPSMADPPRRRPSPYPRADDGDAERSNDVPTIGWQGVLSPRRSTPGSPSTARQLAPVLIVLAVLVIVRHRRRRR